MFESPPDLIDCQFFNFMEKTPKAGWKVTTSNEGPDDWRHYGATIFYRGEYKNFLHSRNADWDRNDAKRHALEWINEQP